MSGSATGSTADGNHDIPACSIVLVGPLPPPEGGMANQTRQLAQLLASESFDVTLVRTNAPYRPAWIASIRGVRAVVRLIPYLRQLFTAMRRAGIVHVMANSGWAWHLLAAPAIWTAHFRGVPVVVHYHGGEAAEFLERQFRFVRRTLHLASAVIVPSEFLGSVFARWDIATDVVPNAIDLSRFHSGEKRARDGVHFLVARNLEQVYDISTALEAFAIIREKYPKAALSVAGTGPMLEALRRRCDELGIGASVAFTGRLESEQMAEIYRQTDVLLNPSLADNMPISILEAFASGVAVVSTDVGGIPFFVENEATALLVPPRNPSAMAAAAMRLIRDTKLASDLRENGLQLVRQYTWPQVRQKLFLIYARTLPRASMKRLGDAA